MAKRFIKIKTKLFQPILSYLTELDSFEFILLIKYFAITVQLQIKALLEQLPLI